MSSSFVSSCVTSPIVRLCVCWFDMTMLKASRAMVRKAECSLKPTQSQLRLVTA